MTDHDPSIVAALDALESQLPELMLANLDEGDFWPEFAGVADSLIDVLVVNNRPMPRVASTAC